VLNSYFVGPKNEAIFLLHTKVFINLCFLLHYILQNTLYIIYYRISNKILTTLKIWGLFWTTVGVAAGVVGLQKLINY